MLALTVAALLRSLECQLAYDGGRWQRWAHCFRSTPPLHFHVWRFYGSVVARLKLLLKYNLAGTLISPLHIRYFLVDS